MNSYWLTLCVFVIGFGWGAVAVLVLFWARAQAILDHCTRILKFQKDILESEDNVRKRMFEYADLVKGCFDASYKQTGRVITGLEKLVDAAKEEERTE